MARRVDGWITPLWLSHHYPEDYERCVRCGRLHLCRRCAVLYPISFVVLAVGTLLSASSPVATAGDTKAGTLTAWAMVALPLPTVVEWTLEHRAKIRYAPARQIALSALLGLGLGAGFLRYFADRWDPLFWVVALLYSGWCGVFGLFLDVRFTAAADINPRPEAQADEPE